MNRSIFTSKQSKQIIANHGSKVMYCTSQALVSLLASCMGGDVQIEGEADIRVFGEGNLPRLHLAIQARSQNHNVINRARRCRRPVIEILAAAFGLNHEEPEEMDILHGVMMLAVGWCRVEPKSERLVGIGAKLANWRETLDRLFQSPEDHTITFLKEACDFGALFRAIDDASILVVPETVTKRVPIDRIDVDGRNFRDDVGDIKAFSEDIRRNGLVHPVTVIPQRNGRFALLTGERRFLALKKAGYKVLDVIIGSPSMDSVTLFRLSENLQSKKNDALELAKAFDMALHEKKIVDANFSQRDLAKTVNIDATQISKYRKLLSIPGKYHDRIRHLDMEKLLIIAGADSEEDRQRLMDLALSGATVEKMRSAAPKPSKKKATVYRHKLTHGGINVTLNTRKKAPTKKEVEEAFQIILQQMFPEA